TRERLRAGLRRAAALAPWRNASSVAADAVSVSWSAEALARSKPAGRDASGRKIGEGLETTSAASPSLRASCTRKTNARNHDVAGIAREASCARRVQALARASDQLSIGSR
ncbi:MAG: hypothetical protein LBV73_21215, partial [Paraburkholderia sp.]|nr:hypothetical protein [Paraburkholderia sp.]